MPFLGCFKSNRWWMFFALATILLLANKSIIKGVEKTDSAQKLENPHGNVMLCTSCHISVSGGRYSLKTGNISRLCQSCHDGQKATREIHPVDIVPDKEFLGRLPVDFPLEEGKITCLTCHDITQQCTINPSETLLVSHFLRKEVRTDQTEFCFYCHQEKDYKPFNVHNQIEADSINTDVCLWCHIEVPDTSYIFQDTSSKTMLRGVASQICGNCHYIEFNNTEDETHNHINLTPSEEMKWYISANEIQSQMNLPLEQLIGYVRAANRTPRKVPMDEKGRITCWTCHNPHEKGLLPDRNPRSIGAESDKSVNHRLRARRADISCRICHQK